MPRLWDRTIDAHRRAVAEAILDTAAGLVATHGLSSVTMSAIAEGAGISRATLYHYFPDVESIVVAWHERELGRHLEQLTRVRDGVPDPYQRLTAVLEAYAEMAHHQHDTEPSALLLHRGAHVEHAERHLRQLLQELLAEAVADGHLRADVAVDELAEYCIHSLAAAGRLTEPAGVHRLVRVTIAGLRATHGPDEAPR